MPSIGSKKSDTADLSPDDYSTDDDDDACSIISLTDSSELGAEGGEEGVNLLAEDSNGNVRDIDKSLILPTVAWTGVQKRIPVLIFKADATVCKMPEVKAIGEKYHMAFKMGKSDCKVVKSILLAHGFHEVHQNSNDYNLVWTGSHVKPFVLRQMLDFQKVNHFPRSYEVTRKDRLFKNIQRMQQIKAFKHFDVVPQSFLIPSEYQDFCAAAYRDKGPWIIKPIASSRGRGIFLVSSPDDVPLDEPMIICRYITNPLLIDGFKFDVRLYVAVTSFDPLLIYLYEEGLTRFATVKFDKSLKSIRNSCMHLTNYSVNKKSSDYVQNDDADVEDYGNKWSLGAMLRYLRSRSVDTTALMMSIEDVIIKALISVELPIATACKMFQPHRGNCFELFGFDILIDENLRPWVLEVNLSPSLACEAPLDLKIKSNMVADLLSLIGMECHDPITRKPTSNDGGSRIRPGLRLQSAKARPRTSLLYRRNRPSTASHLPAKVRLGMVGGGNINMTVEEIRVLARAKEEHARRGGWVRIFPTPETWETYRERSTTSTIVSKTKPTIQLHSAPNAQLSSLQSQHGAALEHAIHRSMLYERKLSCLGEKSSRPTAQQDTEQRTADKQSRDDVARTSSKESTKAVDNDSERTSDVLPHQSSTSDTVLHRSSTENKSRCRNKMAASDDFPEPVAREPRAPLRHYDVIRQIEAGKTMSKVQARCAFATYLTCIQHRLMEESSGKTDELDTEGAIEQMDLVLRFLQRAANNLQQPFKVTVPTTRQPINARRLTLAKELRDFVVIYNKETQQLEQQLAVVNTKSARQIPDTQPAGSISGVAAKKSRMGGSNVFDSDDFRQFVKNASENELEEVLTVYTRLSKSASIFLRSVSSNSNSGSSLQHATSSSAAHHALDKTVDKMAAVGGAGGEDRSSQSRIEKRRERTRERTDSGSVVIKYGGEENWVPSSQPLGSSVLPPAAPAHHHHHQQRGLSSTESELTRNAATVTVPALPSNMASRLYGNTLSSYAGAVAAYSGKLVSSPSKPRPQPGVASIQNNTARPKMRPVSAFPLKSSTQLNNCQQPATSSSAAAEEDVSKDKTTQEAVVHVLQRLASRQKNRQYSAERSMNVLNSTSANFLSGGSGTWNDGGIESLVLQHPLRGGEGGQGDFKANEGRAKTAGARHRTLSWSLQPHQYDDDDENVRHGVENITAVRRYGSSSSAIAPDQLGNYRDRSGFTGTPATTAEYYQRQREMIEQSRALLEESKAKHHMLIAHAHNMQKQLGGGGGGSSSGEGKVEDIPDVITGPGFIPRPPSEPLNSDNKRLQSRTLRQSSHRVSSSSADVASYTTPMKTFAASGPDGSIEVGASKDIAADKPRNFNDFVTY